MRPGRIVRGIGWRAKHAFLLLAHRATRARRISAMVRVRNEEEFLEAAVESIVDVVDEVVIVDNLSTDRTPLVVAALRRRHSGKIVTNIYPHEIRRIGRETLDLLSEPTGVRSPCHSATYYNWCLRLCRFEYVLKWDGDMIATAALASALASWRESRKPILVISGVNVHPSRKHMLAARSTDRQALLAALTAPALPAWATSLARDTPEPRLFPRRFARYDEGEGWTQALASPYYTSGPARAFRHYVEDAAFLHMKFCKRNPFENYSSDLASVIASNITEGAALASDHCAVLGRFGVAAAPEAAPHEALTGARSL